MEKIFIFARNVKEDETNIKLMEEITEILDSLISYSTTINDRNVQIGICQENGLILIEAEYHGITVTKEENHLYINCEKYLYGQFYDTLTFKNSEYQAALWRWKGLERKRFIEIHSFILDNDGQTQALDNQEIYEVEEFAPYLPNQWAQYSDLLTQGKLDCIPEDIESEIKAFQSASKLMFCQEILKIFWIINLQKTQELRYMYSCFWEINALTDFISDKSQVDWKEAFYNRMISTMRTCGHHYEDASFAKWKEAVLMRIFPLLGYATDNMVILEELKPCLNTAEFSLLNHWYQDREMQLKNSVDYKKIRKIIGMEIRHINAHGSCNSKRSDWVQSLFLDWWNDTSEIKGGNI